MTTNIRTKIQKLGRASPAKAPPTPDAPMALPALRTHIADLRVRSDAARQQNEAGISSSAANAPMVAIFQTPLPTTEILTGDRDVQKREEKIRKVLNERGPRRLLGAVAGPELAESLADLHRTHPNFSEAIDLIVGEERLARQRGTALCGQRILLTGSPGIGKTDFAQALASKLGVPMIVISMSAAQASAALGGSENYWSNTQPGQVWSALVQGTHSNPLIILDELEKAPKNWGDPAAALYQLLEPKTASQFIDKSVPWLPIDASRVNWIATVNDLAPLHAAIVSRFVVVSAGAPPETQLRDLIQSLYSALLAEHDLTGQFPARLGRDSENTLLAGSIRDAKRRLRAALGEALRTGAHELVIAAAHTPTTQRRIGFV